MIKKDRIKKYIEIKDQALMLVNATEGAARCEIDEELVIKLIDQFHNRVDKENPVSIIQPFHTLINDDNIVFNQFGKDMHRVCLISNAIATLDLMLLEIPMPSKKIMAALKEPEYVDTIMCIRELQKDLLWMMHEMLDVMSSSANESMNLIDMGEDMVSNVINTGDSDF